jgi:hypothetical protein
MDRRNGIGFSSLSTSHRGQQCSPLCQHRAGARILQLRTHRTKPAEIFQVPGGKVDFQAVQSAAISFANGSGP